MDNKTAPRLLSPFEFWKIYFTHALSKTPQHKIPGSSWVILALGRVFGTLVRYYSTKISSTKVEIECSSCDYLTTGNDPACDAHLGAISGLFETVRKKKFKTRKEIKEEICHILLEVSGD